MNDKITELEDRVTRLEARVSKLAELAESLASGRVSGIVLQPGAVVLPESW